MIKVLLICTILFVLVLCIFKKSFFESTKRLDKVFHSESFEDIKKNKKKIDYTDPDLIKKVLNVNDYTSEKIPLLYSKLTEPQNSIRYFLDENRHNYVEDIPFSPHVILNSYDDIDVSRILVVNPITTEKVEKLFDPENLSSLKEIDRYEENTFQNQNDYCIRNKHKKECVLAERAYKCFGKIEFTQKECEAGTDLIGNRVNPGVWDRRCVADEDCPFYKANKNYPNNFGGCDGGGSCQLPIGLKKIGFRKYLNNSLPLCYNCKNKETEKIEIGTCCDSQKKPDYKFENDLSTRYRYKNILEQNGLFTITHDNYEKEFRDLEKKLKI